MEKKLENVAMLRMNRRTFIKVAGMTAGAIAIGNLGLIRPSFAQQGTPIAGSSIPQFVEQLPLLSVAGGPIETIVGQANIELHMREFKANILPPGFIPGYAGTSVFGYINGPNVPVNPLGTYLGPVVVAERDSAIEMKFVNDLGDTSSTNVKAWKESTDQTLHWADPLGIGMSDDHYSGPIPAVPHLHGGEIPPVLDGGPDAWYTSDGAYHGHSFYTKDGSSSNYSIYKYTNSQEAAPVWFHDHVLGITRLNVYAGLAGAYVIIDNNLNLPTGLHPVGMQRTQGVDYIIPIVIQDRMFDTEGELYFPNIGINPEHPFWIPEFVGDTIVVNGKTWPFMNVEPRRYRFLFVNGSNARTYELFLTNPTTKVNGPPMYQIGTDGGYLETPMAIDPNAAGLSKLRLMPGERADVIIDFAGLGGQTLIMKNTAKTPYPAGAAPNGNTLGKILQFRVQNVTVTDDSYNPANGGSLRSNVPLRKLVDPLAGTLAIGVTLNKTRLLTLNEIMGMGGPLEILVNNTKWSGLNPDGSIRPDFTPVTIGSNTTYYSELPNEGDTELWEIVNLTADAHPIHTHLITFQLMNRQAFDVSKYNAAYGTAFGGVFKPAYGPPLVYNSTDPIVNGKLGGNPDVTPHLKGPIKLPDANERGWKDTIMMLPGQVTRIVVRYAPNSKAIDDPDMYYPFDPNASGHGYVWHCHIIDHEDNEMMRPYQVIPKPGATRTITDY